MKKIFLIGCILMIVILAACEALQTPNEMISDATAGPIYVPATDLPAEVHIDYAQNFTLEYQDGYKILTVTQPWPGATQSYTYFLVPEGVQPPANPGSAQVISTPIDSIVTMSTTYFTFLEDIGQLDTIKAVDDATYVYNETIRSWADSGQIKVVGGGSSGNEVDLEALLELQPDLIMTSASGIADMDVHPRLLEAGLPVVINADYLETTPLGRAEWGKFIAAFYNEEARASQIFDEMAARYQALKTLTEGVQPKVTAFVNSDYQGTWYMPGKESYPAILLQDAGADYLWQDLEGSSALPLSTEVVFERARNADFWLNVGFATDLASLQAMDERYADFKAFQNGQVYNFNARASENGGLDYYESGVARPDVVLADLIEIFYPELQPDYALYYYQQLR